MSLTLFLFFLSDGWFLFLWFVLSAALVVTLLGDEPLNLEAVLSIQATLNR